MIIKAPFFVPMGFKAIAIAPFIFFKGKPLTDIEKAHERIHLRQQYECLWIGFFILYLFFWIRGLIKYKNSHFSYKMIPFELEAEIYSVDSSYVKKRKFYSWRHFT